jgi:hypothetical protein
MQELLRDSILRTLAFHAAWNYAPTRLQLFLFLDTKGDSFDSSDVSLYQNFNTVLDDLINSAMVISAEGKVMLASHHSIISEGKENEIYFARKLRNARRAVKYLKFLPWVSTICLCNTTALGQSSDKSDLDFFIICRKGTIWRTRFFATLPFKLLNARPGERKQDPVCLSFFVTEEALNLTALSLDDDPYMRYWFLSLLPLYDDGVLTQLWDHNREIHRKHPNAVMWQALDKSPVPGTINLTNKKDPPPSIIEKWLRQIQSVRFPKALADIANLDTRVVINDSVLKFHVTDNRKQFRNKYHQICHDLNIES